MSLGPVRPERAQQQPRHDALALAQVGERAEQPHQRVRAGVEQVVVAEGAQRHVLGAARAQRDGPRLLALAQQQRVVVRLDLLDARLRVAGGDLAAHDLVALAARKQRHAVGVAGQLERERLGHGDRAEQVLDGEQRALAGARRRHRQQRRRVASAPEQAQGVESHGVAPSPTGRAGCLRRRRGACGVNDRVWLPGVRVVMAREGASRRAPLQGLHAGAPIVLRSVVWRRADVRGPYRERRGCPQREPGSRVLRRKGNTGVGGGQLHRSKHFGVRPCSGPRGQKFPRREPGFGAVAGGLRAPCAAPDGRSTGLVTAVERIRGDGHVDGNHAIGGGEPDASAERELRLTALLRDVVAQEGRLAAADLLGVNYKTLKRVLESGRLTSHVRDALERLQLAREGTNGALGPERAGALERRIERLEDGLTALMEEPSGEGHGSLSEVLGDGARRRDEDDSSTPAPSGEPPVAEPTPAVAGMRPQMPPALRRPFPDVVTVEHAGDDAEVYSEAWPLVAEWRELRAGHADDGRGVRWLETELRILTLELAMLEEHGLTLPPETQPLRGFARKGQTGWRRTALSDTQRALARAKLRRWVRRVLTLGLWWR